MCSTCACSRRAAGKTARAPPPAPATSSDEAEACCGGGGAHAGGCACASPHAAPELEPARPVLAASCHGTGGPRHHKCQYSSRASTASGSCSCHPSKLAAQRRDASSVARRGSARAGRRTGAASWAWTCAGCALPRTCGGSWTQSPAPTAPACWTRPRARRPAPPRPASGRPSAGAPTTTEARRPGCARPRPLARPRVLLLEQAALRSPGAGAPALLGRVCAACRLRRGEACSQVRLFKQGRVADDTGSRMSTGSACFCSS